MKGRRSAAPALFPFLFPFLLLLSFVDSVPGWPDVECHATLLAVSIQPDPTSAEAPAAPPLVGRLFSPTRRLGQARAPAVLLLRGIPGVEDNADLAYALRDAGLHCLDMRPAVGWGAPAPGAGASVDAARREAAAARRWIAARGDVEADRLVVIGHGLGGYLALCSALDDDAAGGGGAPGSVICGAAALSPLAPGGGAELPAGLEAREIAGGGVEWAGGADAARSAWRGEATVEQLVRARLGRPHNASRTPPLPLLVVSGDADAAARPADVEAAVVAPLRLGAGRGAPLAVRWVRKPHGDHCLSRHRGEVVREVVRFAVRCAGLRGVACGERLGSPWIRSALAFDVFPLIVLAAHVAGFLAGTFSASAEGVALAEAQERAAHAERVAESERRRPALR